MRRFLKKIYLSSKLRWQRLLYQEILVIGDSHAKVFTEKSLTQHFSGIFFNTLIVGGATVSGLENPNSKTQALPLFLRHLSGSHAKKVIVMLGEVDTGFVLWYKAEKHQTDADSYGQLWTAY